MKKNVLAVALVAGLGLAGGAAAYNYGTAAFGAAATTGDSSNTSPSGIATPESVAYEMLVANSYNWTMAEDLVFDIQIPDNAVQFTDGFTVRVALNSRCTPHDTATNPASPPTNIRTCGATGDGAAFNTANIPVAGTGAGQLELNATLVAAGWQVQFDGYSDNGTIASIRIIPAPGNNANPGPGEMLRWHNAQLTSLNEFAATGFSATAKVDAEFWMVNPSNDARFVNSTMSRTILQSAFGVNACANARGAEIDTYIDVADDFNEEQMPKTRFSVDGKLGTADDARGGSLQSSNQDSQVIDLGDVTLGNSTPSFRFWGTGNAFNGVSDVFRTVVDAGAGNDWNAFDNAGNNDDVYLVNGTCSSGTIVDQGTITGSAVTFIYNANQAGMITGMDNTGPGPASLTVCAFADEDIVIDDHNNQVVTTFYRVGMYPANGAAPGDNADNYPTAGYSQLVGSKTYDGASCKLLPLRYNGSTMEIFTINPGSNTTQRSFIRLTNRSATDGYVSLEGIDNAGVRGASQVRVWVEAGHSVQLDAADLENGTNGAVGAWGAPTSGKWRAVVTAEFPGLVATSLVNSALPRVLTNVTDSDTRGEQIGRDFNEGTWGNEPGERPSDFVQEYEPDFRGDGGYTGEPGGPDAADGPAGGTTEAEGNPGLGSP
jgi:hypothetical protein